MGKTPRIYLAGPMVFYPDAEATFAAMKTICAEHGLDGVAPLDNQLGLEGLPPGKALIARIAQADIALMEQVDGALICLDGFRRGPEMDPGTAVEIGYLLARAKRMEGWTDDPRPYPEKVRTYFDRVHGLPLTKAPPNAAGGTSGGWRDPDGMLVHSDGCVQNGMAHIGIELSGGRVHADPDWRAAFTQAAASLAARTPR